MTTSLSERITGDLLIGSWNRADGGLCGNRERALPHHASGGLSRVDRYHEFLRDPSRSRPAE